jgi:hypothetical protein
MIVLNLNHFNVTMEPIIAVLSCVVAGVTSAGEIQRRLVRLFPDLTVQKVNKHLYELLSDGSVMKISETSPIWCLPVEAEKIQAEQCLKPIGDDLKQLITEQLSSKPMTARDLTKILKADKGAINKLLYSDFTKLENNLWTV